MAIDQSVIRFKVGDEVAVIYSQGSRVWLPPQARGWVAKITSAGYVYLTGPARRDYQFRGDTGWERKTGRKSGVTINSRIVFPSEVPAGIEDHYGYAASLDASFPLAPGVR